MPTEDRVFPAEWLLAWAALSGVAGCQPLFGIETREVGVPAPADGGGDSASSEPEPHYCQELPEGGADWSCCRPEPGSSGRRPVRICGTLALAQGIVLETCPYVVPSNECTKVAVDADGGFCMDSIQGDHGEVTWSMDGRSPRATLWTSLSEVANLDVGTVLLVLPETVAQVGTPAGFDVDLTKGIIFAAVMDCALVGAAGVRFVAHSMQSQARTGVSFMFVGLTPKDAPTNDQGLGGIVNVEPGLVTVDAVLPDGCIVGQADVLAEPGTVTYVYLVPNGARDRESLADAGADADASVDEAGSVTDGNAGALD